MKQITVRGVSKDLAKALEKETRRRGTSLNKTVLDLLTQSLGLETGRFDNGLGKLAGSWTEDDFLQFEKDTAVFERVDPELWQ